MSPGATTRRLIQVLGMVLTVAYAAAIAWLYATAPRSLEEARTGATVAAGTYHVDPARFALALDLFHRGEYAAARDEWGRADPALRDPRTQFYVAYACYREGWGRLTDDEALFRQGLAAVDRALALSPGPLLVDDPDLKMHSAAELRAELQAGLTTSWSALNPMRALRERK